MYSKRKYWLFGQVTYYVEMESVTIDLPFAPSGISDIGGDEFIVPRDNPMFSSAGFKGSKAGKDLADIIKALNKTTIPTMQEYLKTLEQEYIECENYEQAAVIRDRIAELKQQTK